MSLNRQVKTGSKCHWQAEWLLFHQHEGDGEMVFFIITSQQKELRGHGVWLVKTKIKRIVCL